MLSRRLFVAGSAFGLGLCECWNCIGAVQADGCIRFEGGNKPNVDAQRNRFPGLRRFDFSENYQNALVLVFADLSELLRISVSFGVYDDPVDSPNAGASSTVLLSRLGGRDATDGTIALGINLVSETRRISAANFGAALSAVAAHEAGHIIQAKYLVEEITKLENAALLMELHADFVCGYYAAFRKAKEPRYPAAIQAGTQFRYGDKGIVLIPHGTPDQRGQAVNEGFLTAQQGILGTEDLARRGLAYVRTIKID